MKLMTEDFKLVIIGVIFAKTNAHLKKMSSLQLVMNLVRTLLTVTIMIGFMTKEEVDKIYTDWNTGEVKIYTYKRFLLPNDYLSICKTEDGDMRLEPSSTRIIKGFNKATWEYLVMEDELVFNSNYGWNTNLVNFKTNGCVCGSWALPNNENLHTEPCSLRKKNI